MQIVTKSRSLIQKTWIDTSGKKHSTRITWDHDGAREEIARLEAAINQREEEARNMK